MLGALCILNIGSLNAFISEGNFHFQFEPNLPSPMTIRWETCQCRFLQFVSKQLFNVKLMRLLQMAYGVNDEKKTIKKKKTHEEKLPPKWDLSNGRHC